jgi:dTDP-4-dehydrorhamnose 3,5-epimerase
MIEGVEITDLTIIEDKRGSIRHMLRRDDLNFDGFGEIYFSTVKRGAVKAWHLHKEMTLNYACVRGEVMVGLVDLREDSSTFGEARRIYLADGGLNYRLLTIPAGIWNGFRISEDSQVDEAWIANLATMAHDPEEIVRVHPRDFPAEFNWGPYEVAG